MRGSLRSSYLSNKKRERKNKKEEEERGLRCKKEDEEGQSRKSKNRSRAKIVRLGGKEVGDKAWRKKAHSAVNRKKKTLESKEEREKKARN